MHISHPESNPSLELPNDRVSIEMSGSLLVKGAEYDTVGCLITVNGRKHTHVNRAQDWHSKSTHSHQQHSHFVSSTSSVLLATEALLRWKQD
jgi:hypothetical protein